MTKIIGRREVLIQGVGAAFGVAAVLANVPAAYSAQENTRAAGEAEARTDVAGFTSVEGIRLEYARAAASWPFALPAGYKMPTTSQLADPAGEAGEWEIGSGVAEAYFNWSTLVALAVVAAAKRGDKAAVHPLLTALDDAHAYAVGRSLMEDPSGAFSRQVISPAVERGDFTNLINYFGVERLERDSPLAGIARSVGDL